MKEKARHVMMKVVNLLSAKMEMGAPIICIYLLDNPDHYTDHTFIPFYWQSYITEAHSYFSEIIIEIYEKHKVALINARAVLLVFLLYLIISTAQLNYRILHFMIGFLNLNALKYQKLDIESLENYLSDVLNQIFLKAGA